MRTSTQNEEKQSIMSTPIADWERALEYSNLTPFGVIQG